MKFESKLAMYCFSAGVVGGYVTISAPLWVVMLYWIGHSMVMLGMIRVQNHRELVGKTEPWNEDGT